MMSVLPLCNLCVPVRSLLVQNATRNNHLFRFMSSFSRNRSYMLTHKEINHPNCATSHESLLSKCQTNDIYLSKRTFFWQVDVAFNKVDEERVRLAGADRACAEWVLRNGGKIRWKGSNAEVTSFNALPSSDFASYKLEEVDLSGTKVIDMGFEHFENIQHLKVVRLHNVTAILNTALLHLDYVADSVEHLEISACPQITEEGLQHLYKYKQLKKLVLYDLVAVQDLDGAVSRLKEAMPWCQVETS